MSSGKGISDDLQDDLRAAMAVELTTIPTYLYAYWSMRPPSDGGSQIGAEAAELIMSVLTEEMLHMGLVSNVLNALGGTPALTDPLYVPQYPTQLLNHAKGRYGFVVSLGPLSTHTIRTFLEIELPEWKAPGPPTTVGWKTIGEFYEGIEEKLSPALNYSGGRQLPTDNNPGPGTMIQVDSYKTAMDALNLIVEQGEGLGRAQHDDGEHELSHYWKFKEIQESIRGGTLNLARDVYPLIENPNGHAHKYTTPQQEANRAFNETYSDLLDALQATMCSAQPQVFPAATGLMTALHQKTAVLRNQGTVPGTDRLAGPTFDYIPTDQR